jgi:uncharacterized protein YecE (DUF72 family)
VNAVLRDVNNDGALRFDLGDNARMTPIWFGTSGFSYKEWKPIFYPQDLTDKQFLAFYSSRLNSVEIDYTFYRMPNAKTIKAGKRQRRRTFVLH